MEQYEEPMVQGKPKIALLAGHDFSIIGGGERHFIDMARMVGADIVCPSYDPEVIRNFDPEGTVRFVSLGASLPAEPWRQVAGMRLFRNLSLDYNFYIFTDDMSVRYLTHHDVPHLYYMLTPRRAFYDMYYYTLSREHGFRKAFLWTGLNIARWFDRRFVKKYVRHIACNSHNVRNRIFKAYQMPATVIYPPVHTKDYYNRPSEGYWLSVGRVDKWKRVDLQVEAFRQMPDKKLKVVGFIHPGFEWIREGAPDNVEFVGTVTEEELHELYARCEGVIVTAIDEDFGLTPVEAMASGKPVVAVREGGYQETVIDGVTGMLVSPEVRDICRGIIAACRSGNNSHHVQRFDYSEIEKQMNGIISEILTANK